MYHWTDWSSIICWFNLRNPWLGAISGLTILLSSVYVICPPITRLEKGHSTLGLSSAVAQSMNAKEYIHCKNLPFYQILSKIGFLIVLWPFCKISEADDRNSSHGQLITIVKHPKSKFLLRIHKQLMIIILVLPLSLLQNKPMGYTVGRIK